MGAVTEFEVLVLEKGRWIVHAHYSAAEHKRAVWDARYTEKTTGMPAKVVRETFFPEKNERERITTYVSPGARKRINHAKGGRPMPGQAPGERKRAARRALTPSQIIFRIVVAGGFSLIAASVGLAVIYWLVQRLDRFGVALPQSPQVLAGAYAALFFFFFTSMFRSRLPLHRLLADLWQKTPTTKSETAHARVVPPPAMTLRPKNASTTAPAKLKEWEELRVLRGDPDVAQPVEEYDVEPELPEPPAFQAAPAPEPAPQPVAAAAPQTAAPPPVGPQQIDETAFRTVQLKRFVSEVVVPAAAHHMPDDPVARRALSLLISGVVDAMTNNDQLPPANEEALLTYALKAAGLPAASVELFIGQRVRQKGLAANHALVAAGRAAMADFMAGAEVTGAVIDALAAWRTPFGVTSALFTQPTNAAPAPVRDIFMLTEIRPSPIGSDAEFGAMFTDDSAQGRVSAHNTRVRAALDDFSGREIKHTGKGVFAQFSSVGAAIACAQALQGALASASACALIASTEAYDDPALSSTLFLRAEVAVAGVEDGGLTIEPRLLEEFFGGEQLTHEAAASRAEVPLQQPSESASHQDY